MANSSIRARIQRRLVPLVLGSWLGASFLVYFGTQSELQDALNAQKDVMAKVIAELLDDEIDPKSLSEDLERYKDDYLIRIWNEGGALSFDSQGTPSEETPAFRSASAVLGPEWTASDFRTTTGIVIQIARLKQETAELVNQIALTSLLSLALALLGSVIAVLFFVRDGLKPLTQLSADLKQRSVSDLGDLAQDDRVEELKPIVLSLNSLFDRIRNHLMRERRFVDDAAHELRTPLSVIKAQCQAIDRTMLDTATQERIDNVIAGVDRMARLTSRLLDQTHAEQEPAPFAKVQVAPVLRGVIADLLNDTVHAQTRVDLDVVDDAIIDCVSDDLHAISRNLIENAIKFSGQPGYVSVTLTDSALTVEDDGKGVTPERRVHIFERFGRSDQKHDGKDPEGTGLGLSIVKSLALRNDFKVSVSKAASLGGASFRVGFL
ncbi:MAG: ATP-binding protein [Pseudomonadota bacterium]